jgi:hemerythrin
MKLDLIAEVWDALRDHIDLIDRGDAADTLVNLLIDNNYEVDEIKDTFKDKDITTALKGYAEQHFQDEEYEEEEQDNDEWD